MANRLTKGKALIGSLDVQGELTVNGAPVGAGGTNNNPPLVYTANYDPSGMMSEYWTPSMGYFRIRNNSNDSMYMSWQQNFITNNNIQAGDTFDVEVEWRRMDGEFRPAKENNELNTYLFRAVTVLDYMTLQPEIRVIPYAGTFGGGIGSVIGRYTLRKKG